jgi:hypothetical protein
MTTAWRTRLGVCALAVCAGAAVSGQARAMEFSDVVTGNELRFLAARPDPEGYWYESRVMLDADSLTTGLVQLRTCHHQLDPTHRIVIAFNAERVQHIAVASAQGVGSAEVVNKRVELRDVQRGGSVCVDLTSRALDATDSGWRLHAGPLMRRYLDGYLPMRAKLSFGWPKGLLALAHTEPQVQPGVLLTQAEDGAQLDITFAGRMRATLDLTRR